MNKQVRHEQARHEERRIPLKEGREQKMTERTGLTSRFERERTPRGNAVLVARCQGVVAVRGWLPPLKGGFRHLKRSVINLNSYCIQSILSKRRFLSWKRTS